MPGSYNQRRTFLDVGIPTGKHGEHRLSTRKWRDLPDRYPGSQPHQSLRQPQGLVLVPGLAVSDYQNICQTVMFSRFVPG